MLGVHNSKKAVGHHGNMNTNHSEIDGMAQVLEQSKGHLSPNIDIEKVRKPHLSASNAFGEIEFTGLNQSAKFVRLPTVIQEGNIQNILQTKWELSYPTLVISIFGGDFEKKRKLKMIIKKGLWKAAESAGCWIVTEGLNLGIMKLAGEAVRDYTDAYGGNKMIAIGVASWNGVAKNDVLENALDQGAYPAIYQSEEETESNEDGCVPDKTKNKSLDTNHTYFFLFDGPPSQDNPDEDAKYRSQFEHAISLWKSPTSTYEAPNEIRVPICGLIVGGDIITLKQVFHSIIDNKCPVVVCQGTSGAADVLALSVDAAQKFYLEDHADDQEIVSLETRLESIIRECFHKINPEITDFKSETVLLKEIVTNLSYLISVFDMEEDWDLDGYIISSLLSSAGSQFNKNHLNLEQLEIALTLNRADIAKEKIFLENKKWKKGDLNDYMFNALMSDRHDFVKLFLEQGFSLEEFLSVFILEKLYTEQIKNMNSRIEIFHRLWDNHKTHKLVQSVKLREVGKVIKILVGDFYHPLYLSKEFQNLCLKSLASNSKNRESLKINQNQKLQLNPSINSFESRKLDDETKDSEESHTSIKSKLCKFPSYRTLDFSKNQEDLVDNYFEKERNIYQLKRSSSLNMIDMLSQVKLSDILNGIHRNEAITETRRVSSLDFRETDKAIFPTLKSAMSTFVSKKALKKNRMEKHIPANLDDLDDKRLKEISLERPARELMIWSLLVGKLQMAELFWTMEKEQIAGALLASMLLTSLSNRTDDFTDKEDYKSYSRHFECQAEGVLNECYIEDEKRAQLLINKELKYYGHSSVILLAAQGQSIKFMAHPCCQDFLTSTWYGKLSSKNSVFRILGSVALGLILPIVIPNIVTYTEDEISNSVLANEPEHKHTSLNLLNAKEDVEIGKRFIFGNSKFIANPKSLLIKRFPIIGRIKDFYYSPIVRFVYNAVSYISFLLLFSTFLLFKFKVEFVLEEVVLTIWVATLLLEEIKQIFSATFSGISFSTYFSDGWNKLDSSAITFFVLGFILRFVSYINNKHKIRDLNSQYHIILTDPYFIGAQTCMGCSLFIFYVRVMYIFSFHIALGPKMIMIRKMISNDLIPFMMILSVFMIGYGITSYANAYPLGLQFTDDNLNNPSTILNTTSANSMIMTILLKSYYPMFGDFGLDSSQGNSPICMTDQPTLVPTKISRTLIPLFMGLHVLLTNVLLFNLLIAMFTKTYEEIESSSVYYWNYQRYQMISEFVKKSPLVPPVIIFWHFYELHVLIQRKFFKNQLDEKSLKLDPFCINFSQDLKKERELVKWEHMKAMDYIRKLNEPATQKSRQVRGGDGRSLVFRGFGVGSSAANALVPKTEENKPEMSSLAEELNHQLEKRFKEIDAKFSKLYEVEVQIVCLSDTIRHIGTFMTDINKMQDELMKKIENIPKCQCTETVKIENDLSDDTEEEVTKLELAVRSAILGLKAELQPLFIESPPSKVDLPIPEVEEVDLESQCSFLGNDDTGDSMKDPVFAPKVENSSTGRVVERIVNNHRIWRYLPFNFELYPGMRMKVPNNMVSWQISYPDYNAFDANEETLLHPNDLCYDSKDPSKYKDSYNSYDQVNKVKRQSMLGQYAIDPATNAPLNPTGRTGLKGKGLLPHWGPNHSIIILFTKWTRSKTGSPIHRKNKRLMQFIALERANRFGIPWFLIDHTQGCDLNDCTNKTTMSFLDQRLESQFSIRKMEFIKKKIISANRNQIFKGFLEDHLNADNAWVETVVVNFHESEKYPFTDDLLKIFVEENSPEAVKWLDVAHSVNLRTSHDMILKNYTQKMNAYF